MGEAVERARERGRERAVLPLTFYGTGEVIEASATNVGGSFIKVRFPGDPALLAPPLLVAVYGLPLVDDDKVRRVRRQREVPSSEVSQRLIGWSWRVWVGERLIHSGWALTRKRATRRSDSLRRLRHSWTVDP